MDQLNSIISKANFFSPKCKSIALFLHFLLHPTNYYHSCLKSPIFGCKELSTNISMKRLKKLGKYAGRLLLTLLALLLLIVLLIQLPPVQSFLTQRTSTYLKNKLQTEVRIAAIRLRLPRSLVLKGVYLEDQRQDTLLNVSELALHFRLNKLLSKQVQLNRLTLKGGTLNLYADETGFSNYAFIGEAFGGPADSTAATAEETKPTSSAWTITANPGKVDLQNIRLNYADDPRQLSFGLDLERLALAIRSMDLQNNHYQLESLQMAGCRVSFASRSPDTSATAESTPVDYQIAVGSIDIERSGLNLQLTGRQMKVSLDKLQGKELGFSLLDGIIDVRAPQLYVEQGAFQYDLVGTEPSPAGFDPNHFDFRKIGAEMGDITYRDGILGADVRLLTAQNKEEFTLENLRGKIYYALDSIRLEALELLAGASMFNTKQTYIHFGEGGTSSPAETWRVLSSWDIQRLHTADMLYWYPDLKKLPYFSSGKRVLKSQGEITGSLADLKIVKLILQDRDISADLRGRIAHVTDPDRMKLDLDISRLGSTREGIRAWLPAGALPAYIQLPDRSDLRGSIRGGLEELQVRLQAETRRGPVPAASHLASRIKLRHVTDLDRLQFDVQLDSFYITRPDLLAYLPPDLLPETVRLPESFSLQGMALGRLATFVTDLNLVTFRRRQSTTLQLTGRVDSLTLADQPTVGLAFTLNGMNRSELEAWLPDDLLPTPMQAPDFTRLNGHFEGRPDSLEAELNFGADVAGGRIAGSWIESKRYRLDIDLASIRPDRLYPEGYLDSILGFSMAPLGLVLRANGSGFDSSPETRGDWQLNIYKQGMVKDSGLVLKAGILQQVIRADVRSSLSGLDLVAGLSSDYSGQRPQTDLSFQLRQLDLQQLKVSDIPVRLSGVIEAAFRGASVDTLSGRLLADDWSILYDSTQQVIDSLLFTAEMDNGANDLRITSDLLNARFAGFFRTPRVFTALQQQLMRYWDAEAIDTLVGRTEDRLAFNLEIKRPEIFTMGFVPGLLALAPASFDLEYDNREATIEMALNAPHVQWREIRLDSIEFSSSFQRDQFEYELVLRNADIQRAARVPAMRWEGSYAGDRLAAAFIALDDREQDRFVVKTNVQRLDTSTYRLTLEPRQLLDYQWWQMSAGNELVLRDEQVSVNDWRLFREKEMIELAEVGRDRLRVLFRHFDLDLVANVLDQQNPYLGGIINGNISIANPMSQPTVAARLTVDSLHFFDARLGNLALNGGLDQEKVNMEAVLVGSGHDLKLVGNYRLKAERDAMDFQLDLTSANLTALEPLAFGYLEEVEGTLSGGLHITGVPEKIGVEGSVHFDSTNFHVGLLNTRLRIGSQSIVFDDRGVAFQDLEIFDAQNKRGVLKGRLLTDDYRSFDLRTDLLAENFAVLNTTSADNDLYYGKLVVDAEARIRGRLEEPDIELFARPRKGSSLTYVYREGTPQVDSYQGIVEFVSPEDSTGYVFASQQLMEGSRELNMKVSVKLEVTDNLAVKVITNPLTNDYFEGKAKGNLNYTQFPDGRMELTGLLEMVEGNYLFTYQEVVRRTFRVQPGGTIRWTGDPVSPELNITVLYEVETSPYPLLTQEYENVENLNVKRKETFRVELSISGTPSNTDISTSLVYPEITANSNSAEIQNSVQRVNRDPSQQNTQAFALILFNGFIGASAGGQSDFQVSDLELESNIGNLITKQLNNLANRYINFVELDIDLENYEKNTEASGERRADFRVSLRKQFLNDRLSISLDGVASAQTDQQSTNTTYFLDNLTFEYDLTPDGRFRIKVYNRRDYDDIIGGTSLKVGGALVFSRDFNEFRLFEKK